MAALLAIEGYANNATTLLNGAYTAGSGVLTVDSTAAPFPQNTQFRVVIQDASTKAVIVILKVTDLNSGTQWGVTAEGADANAADNSICSLMLTAGAMDQICMDTSGYGLDANLPNPAYCRKGSRYKPSDKVWEYIHNGSAWQAYYLGVPIKPPKVADFTVVNSGNGLVRADTAGGMFVTRGFQGGYTRLDWNTAPPSTPYKLTVGFSHLLEYVNTTATGPYFREFNGTPINASYEPLLAVQNGASVESKIGNYVLARFTSAGYTGAYTLKELTNTNNPCWLRMENDGTNIKSYASRNGIDWSLLETHAVTNFLTGVAAFGIYMENEANGSGDKIVHATYFHWEVT